MVAICGGVALAAFDSVACEHTDYMPEDKGLLAQLRAIHKFTLSVEGVLIMSKVGFQLEAAEVFEHQPAEEHMT